MLITGAEFFALFIGAISLLIGSNKFFLDRTIMQIDRRFDPLEKSNEKVTDSIVTLERDYLNFKAELPFRYILRDDGK